MNSKAKVKIPVDFLDSTSGKPGHMGAKHRGKQIRRALNLESKLKIIELLEEGKSSTRLSKCIGVPESSIRTIVKNKEKIKKFAFTSYQAETKCRIKDVDLVNMESLLLLWIDDQIERQVILSAGRIRTRAVKIYHYLSKDRPNDRVDFKGSVSWYDRFKLRYSLGHKVTGHADFAVCHEVANERTANLFIFDFNSFIESEGYQPDQIFCIKETKLFWKKIPGADIFKPAIDRTTLVLSSNMAATIRCKPSAVFSMDRNLMAHLPHPNECECCELPVNWYLKGTTWMNSALFQEWLVNKFTPEVKVYCQRKGIPFKILLLMDKVPSHQDLPQIPNINVMYLPPNTDSLINPMNHGIISEFQICYLKKTLEALLEVIDTKFHKSLNAVWENFGKNDAIDLIGQTWNEISETTMKEAWACLSENGEDTQSWESRMADTIELCLQLYEKLVDGNHSVADSEAEILELLKSHNQEVSNEELADLGDLVPFDFNLMVQSQRALGSKIHAGNNPISIKLDESVSKDKHDLHNIPEKSKNIAENDDESYECIDLTYEIESSSSEINDYDTEDLPNGSEETLTGSMKDSYNKFNPIPVDVEVIIDEESQESFGNPIRDKESMKDQEEEGEINPDHQVDDHINGESKEFLCTTCKIETSSSDVIEISDEEPQNDCEAVLTRKVKLSSWENVKLETDIPAWVKIEDSETKTPITEENRLKPGNQEYPNIGVLVKIEEQADVESNNDTVETLTNATELPTISHLQRLIGLTHQLIAKSRENDPNSTRCDQFIANVEDAMRPYKMLLDLKHGGDELW